MPILSTPRASAYLKLDKEDPEEVSHRRALFLIYKRMEEADSLTRSRPPCLFLRIRFRKEKLRIGKRLRKLRKGISSMFLRGQNKDVAKVAKAAWILCFSRKDEKIAAIPPLLV
ncbi:hypothetical protein MLD38_039809 [Melastoma candidum]|uniref:Uncharacterized protein n=1 Tax=Melastoma candidum TaxID=119954 RepID=A0ACB9L399_9MYRT|nr:hypothetical protein MLD38_039809 [Melastoma candidum]